MNPPGELAVNALLVFERTQHMGVGRGAHALEDQPRTPVQDEPKRRRRSVPAPHPRSASDPPAHNLLDRASHLTRHAPPGRLGLRANQTVSFVFSCYCFWMSRQWATTVLTVPVGMGDASGSLSRAAAVARTTCSTSAGILMSGSSASLARTALSIACHTPSDSSSVCRTSGPVRTASCVGDDQR